MDRSEWGDDDAEPTRPPLPPEDRIWRHPSELGSAFLSPGPAESPPTPSGPRTPVVLVAVAAGVLLLVAAGMSVRVLADRSPGIAAADVLGTSVSLQSTTAPPTTQPPVGRGTDLKVEATLDDGTRTSYAVAVDSTTLVTTMTAVAGATKLSAVLPDGRRLAARLLGTDPRSGVAVLGVRGGRVDEALTGSAVGLRTGQEVWTASGGDPGTVMAMGQSTMSPYGSRLRHVMQLDFDQRRVREGTAIVDDDGKVVAICTRDAGGDLVGIPIDLATSAARSLRTHGERLVLPWIGVIGTDVAPGRRAGVPHGGALLTSIDRGGPAEAAGLEEGDIVVALGGTRVTTISALILAARAYEPGDVVPVTLLRDGRRMEIPLTLGQLP